MREKITKEKCLEVQFNLCYYMDFFPRKVIVYRELSQGAISFLGLSRNDETTNSLKTSHFEELKIMRKFLYSKHGGKFSNRYQARTIYISFSMPW